MIQFVKSPNLPAGDVTSVAISEDAEKAINALNSMGIKTLKIKKSPLLPCAVASHADLQILHLKDNTFLTATEHLCIGEPNLKINPVKLKGALGSQYPQDVPLNCTFIGNKLICNKNTVAKEILEFAESLSYNIIHVRQGYSRCSIAVIDENAIITDDISIFAAAQNFLNDVLFISKGSIELKGYNYGFIGGCCGKISKDTIAFNGRIESHSNANQIIDFLEKHKIQAVELDNNRLNDIGGILPLTETL